MTGVKSIFRTTWLSAMLRPTLFLSSVLGQRNAFLARYSPASKQAGTGRMWAELGICSTPPRDRSSLAATTTAEARDGNKGLFLLRCLPPWLLGQGLPSPPAWPGTTHGHCSTSLSTAGRYTSPCAGPSTGTRVLGKHWCLQIPTRFGVLPGRRRSAVSRLWFQAFPDAIAVKGWWQQCPSSPASAAESSLSALGFLELVTY